MKKLFTLLLAVAGMVSTASAQLYLRGDFTDWATNTISLDYNDGDGTYTTTTSYITGWQRFILSPTSGDWDAFNSTRISPSSEDQTIVFDENVTWNNYAPSNSEKAYKFYACGSYKITVNLTEKKLTVTPVSKMYVMGAIQDIGWASNKGKEMTYKGKGIYTTEITTTGDGYICFTGKLSENADDYSSINDYRLVKDGGNSAYSVRTRTNLTSYSNDNQSSSLAAGTYKVVLDLNGPKAFFDDYTYYMMTTTATGGTSGWTVGDQLAYDGLTCSVSIDGSGKYFVIVPNAAITAGSFNGDDAAWKKVIRPNLTSGLYWVGFQTYDDATKTNVSGNANDPRWWITKSGDYENAKTNPGTVAFTYTPYTGRFTINNSYQRTVTSESENYATFGLPYDADVTKPEGAAVKYASAIAAGKITWLDIPDGIPANQGVLLEGAGTYIFTPAASTPTSFTSKLVAIPAKTQLAQVIDSKTNYILAKVNNKVGFYKVNENGSWVGANTAYLAVASGEASARGFFPIWDDEATSIEAIENAQAEGQAYNLAGQRIANPVKGLYIVNGKKVIIK